MISEIEIAWLAGLLEGEGNFGLNWNAIRSGKSTRVRIQMTDEDIIQRVAELWGRINGKRYKIACNANPGRNKQSVYLVCCYGQDANAVMRLVVGYMGYRRRQKIWQTLNGYEPSRDKPSIAQLLDLATKQEIAG